MTTYEIADDEAQRLLKTAIERWHTPRLKGVTIALVSAWAKITDEGEEAAPALKVHGVPALARVRIVPHLQRVQGMADAEIAYDGNKWMFRSDAQRLALLDHELTHIEVVLADDGKTPRTDDSGRPKLRMRPHDYQIGHFDEVRERHGAASIEHEQLTAIFNERGQGLFPFAAAEQPAEVEA